MGGDTAMENIGLTTPGVVPQVQDALNAQSDFLEKLVGALMDLELKLNPVLGLGGPEKQTEPAIGQTLNNSPRISEIIALHNRRIRVAISKIRDIQSRLEI